MRPAEPGFDHRAFFYEGTDRFLEGMVPFIAAGVDAGEAVLVATDNEKIGRLRAELGPSSDHLRFEDMAELGRNPGRIISAWSRFLDSNLAEGRRVRGVGEPVWSARSSEELVECQRHESLLNVAFGDGPAWTLVCPYDVTSLGADVLETACCSHPTVVREGTATVSDTFRPTGSGPFDGELPDPTIEVEYLPLGAGGLKPLRDRIREQAGAAGLGPARTSDFVLAVSEAAANTIRHAGGRGSVGVWRENGSLICEVRDVGRIGDPLAGRLPPVSDQLSGRGLWLINQVCDLVQIRSSERATVVRMRMYC